MSEWREYAPFASDDIDVHDCEVEQQIRNGGPSGRDLYLTLCNRVSHDNDYVTRPTPERVHELFRTLPEEDQAHVRVIQAQLEGVVQRLAQIL